MDEPTDPAVTGPSTARPTPGTAARHRPVPARRPRLGTAQRREDILRAAMATFGARGYYKGSLEEVAEQVGMTRAGVLHHFGSKDQLLLDVLEYRDRADVAHLEDQHMPAGLDLFRHLIATARGNMERPGIVRTYTVLSAESVTQAHPGRDWFTDRYQGLRAMVVEALELACEPGIRPRDAELQAAAEGILAVMDGLQIQWLLDPDAVDLAQSTAFAIEAIVAAVVHPRENPALG